MKLVVTVFAALVLNGCRTHQPPVVAATEEAPCRVIGEVRAPLLVKRVEPTCPATSDNPASETILEAVVGKDGRIRDTKVIEGNRTAFVLAAEQALGEWQFVAGTLNSNPVMVILTFRVQGCWLSPPLETGRSNSA
jgi:hypothetical protein